MKMGYEVTDETMVALYSPSLSFGDAPYVTTLGNLGRFAGRSLGVSKETIQRHLQHYGDTTIADLRIIVVP